MAVNVQRYVAMHKSRRVKRTRVATAAGSLSLAALLTVSWGLKYIGFSLTNNQPFSLNTTVTRLDTPNPDTSVVGDNFYRQYLNIEGKEEATPIDLLLLVDQSGSMAQNKDFTFGESLEYRDVILSSFLNGEANANYRENPEISDLNQYVIESIANEDGFVNQFLGINPDNKIAIIGLNTVSDSTISNGYTAYENAQVILDWTSDPLSDKGVDVTAQYESGTDYAAGLMLANEMLGSDKVTKDGHKKVLIVIGDGEPTCYTDLEGNVISFIAPSVEEGLEVTVVPEDITETDETAVIEETTESTEVIENNNSEVTEPTTTETEATVETTETTVEEAVETDVTEATEETQITDETIPTETTEEVVVETEETEPTIEETEVTEPEVTESTESTEATEVIDETEPSETSSEEVAETEVTEYVEETQVTESAVVEETSETEPSMDMAVVTEETIETTIQEEERDLFKGIKKISKEETDVVTEDVAITESEEAAVAEEVTVAPQISSVDMDAYKSECNKATLDAFKALIENNEDLVVYSIGLSEDLKLTSLEENAEKFVITQLISENGEYIYVENNVDKLSRDIFNLLEKDMPNGVVVTAELSNYVQIIPMESSEIKVTMTDEDGNVTVLYDEVNGGITEAGKYIVEDVVIVEPEEGEADTNGSVNLVFKPQYVLNEGVTYTLSYNVFLTSGAYEMYLSEGYTDKGDKNTDFDSDSKVSSSKKGFYINRDAYVTYVLNGNRVGYNVEEGLNVFNRPVVQVDEDVTTEEIEALIEFEAVDYQVSGSFPAMNYTITGKTETPDSQVVLNKNIDSLGDDEPNPDTTLTGSEFYRLYLDIEGHDESKPVDLLIVVDRSGSMFDNADVSYNGQTMYRDVAVSNILNGQASIDTSKRTGDYTNNGSGRPGSTAAFETYYDSTYKIKASVTSDSFINQFLDLNPNNKVAVIGFDAWRSATESTYRYSDETCQTRDDAAGKYTYFHAWSGTNEELGDMGGYTYKRDTDILTDWTSQKLTNNPVDVTGQYNTGTNYDAGFRLAYDMLTDASVKNDGRDKVMVFISDGVPTCYIDDDEWGNRKGSTTSTLYNSSTPNTYNIVNVCRDPSIAAFGNFLDKIYKVGNNENIDELKAGNFRVYSVGISNELKETTDSSAAYSDAVISKCIAGSGKYLFVGDNGNTLHNQLYNIINYTLPSQVVIRDELSQYVEYYDQQPDVQVSMFDDKGQETVLYRNGSITTAGKGIIQKVTYTPTTNSDTSTGTIVATFEKTYALQENYKYSLSYNVKLTTTSYEEYVGNGYNATGYENTDYGSNGTSSKQDGFFSNKNAEVDFHFYEDTKTGTYDHPVVQVDKTDYFTDVTVVKNWEDDNGPINPVEPVKVQLWQVGTPVSMSIYEDFNDLNFAENCIYKGIDQNNIQLVDVDGSGNKAVHITGRTDDWRGFDLNLTELKGKEVTIETSVKSSGGTVYGILYYNDGSNHYPRQFTIEGCTNEYKTGSAKITVPENATTCTVYLSTVGANDDLYIDYFNAVVPTAASLPAYVPPLADTNNATTLNENFGNTTNYSDRVGDVANTELVDADYPGNKAVMVTDRSQNWHGISVPINNFAGKTITYEVRGMATNGSVQVGVQYRASGANQDSYQGQFSIANSTGTYNSGVGTYTIPAGATNCSVFVQGTTADADLYVDYVYISVDQYTPPHPDMNVTTATYENFATEDTGTYNQRTGNNKLDTDLIVVDETGNNALHISNRQNDWNGISFPADKFIGQQITVEVRGKASSGNISYGVQYDVGGKTTYNNCSQVISSTSAYGVGSQTFDIPNNATNCSVYIQGSGATSTLDLDYVYIYVTGNQPNEPSPDTRNPIMTMPDDVQSEATATDGPYQGGEVILSYSENLNSHVFQNLPKWGYDENGNKLMYSYYVIEDTEGKTYESTTYSNAATPVTEGTITITNKVEGVFGFELPNTGGIGTGFNYLIGFILICIPGGFYIRRIQKRSVRDP